MNSVFSNPLQRLCDGLLYELRHDARLPSDFGAVPDSKRISRLATAFLINELSRPKSTLIRWVMDNTDYAERPESPYAALWAIMLNGEELGRVRLDPKATPSVVGWTYQALLDVAVDLREDGL